MQSSMVTRGEWLQIGFKSTIRFKNFSIKVSNKLFNDLFLTQTKFGRLNRQCDFWSRTLPKKVPRHGYLALTFSVNFTKSLKILLLRNVL